MLGQVQRKKESQVKLNNLKRIPIGCTLRFTPKPLKRDYGKRLVACNFVGGPFDMLNEPLRHYPLLPLRLAGGAYIPTSPNTLTWSAT